MSLNILMSSIHGGDVRISLPVTVQSHLTINNSHHNLTSQLAAGRNHNVKSLLEGFKSLPTDEMAGTLMKILSEVGDMEIVDKVSKSINTKPCRWFSTL